MRVTFFLIIEVILLGALHLSNFFTFLFCFSKTWFLLDETTGTLNLPVIDSLNQSNSVLRIFPEK
mgnify:CR=1 FL=1